MRVAISLLFDPKLESEIKNVWSKLEQQKISSILYNGKYRPHVTLGVWEINNLDALSSELSFAIKKISRFSIRFDSIGVFPGSEGVVFLAPVVNSELLVVHSEISSIADRFGTPFSNYYRPGVWVPHCTLACKIAAIEVVQSVQICTENSLISHSGMIEALGLIQTPEEIELKRIEFS